MWSCRLRRDLRPFSVPGSVDRGFESLIYSDFEPWHVSSTSAILGLSKVVHVISSSFSRHDMTE